MAPDSVSLRPYAPDAGRLRPSCSLRSLVNACRTIVLRAFRVFYHLAKMSIDLVSQIRSVAERLADEGGLFVLDVQVRGHQGARMIEVFIDGVAGVDVGALASISRRLAAHLEEHDVVKGSYRLNVSSPGADRALTDRRQFVRNVGRELLITHNLNDKEQTLAGTLAAVEEDALVLDLNGTSERVAFDVLLDARVKLPW